MFLVLQNGIKVNTGSIDVTQVANQKFLVSHTEAVGIPDAGRHQLALCAAGTTTGDTWAATVAIYPVFKNPTTKRFWKGQSIYTCTISNTTPVQSASILHPAQILVAEVTFTTPPTNDVVDVIAQI